MPLLLSFWELALTALCAHGLSKISSDGQSTSESSGETANTDARVLTPSLLALGIVMSLRAALFPATQTVVLTPLIQMNRIATPLIASVAAVVLFKTLGWGAAPEITQSRIVAGTIVLIGIIATDIAAYFGKSAGWSLETGAAFLVSGVIVEGIRPVLMQQHLTGKGNHSESLGVLCKACATGAIVSFLGTLALEGGNLSLTWNEVSANKESYAELLLVSGVAAMISNIAVYQLFWQLSDAAFARALCGVGAEILAVAAGWLVFDAPVSVNQIGGYCVALLALWRFLKPLEVAQC